MNSSAVKSFNIELITDKNELEGTCYFEFAPGRYSKKHWQEGWVYLEEDVMYLLEPVFIKIMPGFDWYSMNEISRYQWFLIVDELKKLKESLKKATVISDIEIPMRFHGEFEKAFVENFEDCKNATVRLITDLCKWLNIQLKTHEVISVLGL